VPKQFCWISSESDNYPMVLVDCSDVLLVASFTGTFYSNNTAEKNSWHSSSVTVITLILSELVPC